MAATAIIGLPCLALDLVRNGKPMATIVIPAQPLPVESYAAEEFRYHIKEATGADLSIVSENKTNHRALESIWDTARRRPLRKQPYPPFQETVTQSKRSAGASSLPAKIRRAIR